MRLSKVKFNRIVELKDYLELLNETIEFLGRSIFNNSNKLLRGEYAEQDDILFATTKDEIEQAIKYNENDIIKFDYIRYLLKLELKALRKEKKVIIKKYNSNAISIKYSSNKKETKTLTINENVLAKQIHKLKYRIEQEKDRFHILIIFKDETILQRYISTSSVKEIKVRVF